MAISRKVRNKRFIGRGNVLENGHAAWQVTCSQCHKLSKLVRSSGKHSMPPEIIIKKLSQSGWLIGSKPAADLCQECQHRTVKSHTTLAAKAINECVTPAVVLADGQHIHYAEMEAAIANLPAEQAKQLISMLREHAKLSAKPRRQRAVHAKAESDPNYQDWLEDIAKNPNR